MFAGAAMVFKFAVVCVRCSFSRSSCWFAVPAILLSFIPTTSPAAFPPSTTKHVFPSLAPDSDPGPRPAHPRPAPGSRPQHYSRECARRPSTAASSQKHRTDRTAPARLPARACWSLARSVRGPGACARAREQRARAASSRIVEDHLWVRSFPPACGVPLAYTATFRSLVAGAFGVVLMLGVRMDIGKLWTKSPAVTRDDPV